MIEIIGMVFGFLAPFLPDLLGFLKTGQANKHEKEIMRLQMEGQSQQALHKANAMILDSDNKLMQKSVELAHQPFTPYSVQLLNALKDRNLHFGWFVVPYYLFAVIDTIHIAVRPVVTSAIVAFYIYIKLETMRAAYALYDGAIGQAALASFNETDATILFTVIGYWFGHKVRQKSLGTYS